MDENLPVFKIIALILGLLMTGNVFFIKRLVDQIDTTSEIVRQLRQDVVILKITVDNYPQHPHLIRSEEK